MTMLTVVKDPDGILRSRLRRRTLIGLGAKVTAIVGGTGTAVLTTTVLTRQAGVREFGYMTLVASVPALFPLSSLGVSAPLINAFAEIAQGNDWSRSIATVRSAARALTYAASIMLLATVALSLSKQWHTLLGTPRTLDLQVSIAMTIIVSSIGVSLLAGIGYAVLTGLDHLHVGLIVQAVAPFMACLLALIFMFARVSYVLWAIIGPVSQAIAGLIALKAADKRCDAQLLHAIYEGVLNRGRYIAIWAEAVPMASMQISRGVGLQTDRLVLSHRSTPDQLGQYSVVAQFYQVALSLSSSLALALWPRFARERDTASGRKVLMRTSGAYLTIGCLFAIAIYSLGPTIFTTLSGQRSPSHNLFLAFGVLIAVTSLLQPVSMYLTDRRGLLIQACLTGIAQVANLVMSWLLAPAQGAFGVTMSSAISVGILLGLPLIAYGSTRRISSPKLNAAGS